MLLGNDFLVQCSLFTDGKKRAQKEEVTTSPGQLYSQFLVRTWQTIVSHEARPGIGLEICAEFFKEHCFLGLYGREHSALCLTKPLCFSLPP